MRENRWFWGAKGVVEFTNRKGELQQFAVEVEKVWQDGRIALTNSMIFWPQGKAFTKRNLPGVPGWVRNGTIYPATEAEYETVSKGGLVASFRIRAQEAREEAARAAQEVYDSNFRELVEAISRIGYEVLSDSTVVAPGLVSIRIQPEQVDGNTHAPMLLVVRNEYEEELPRSLMYDRADTGLGTANRLPGYRVSIDYYYSRSDGRIQSGSISSMYFSQWERAVMFHLDRLLSSGDY